MKMTQSEVMQRFEREIPPTLREKFAHMNFAEMAQRPECADYAAALEEMESDWWNASDA